MTIFKSDAVSAGVMPDSAMAGVVLCRTAEVSATRDDYEIITGDTLQMIPIPKNAKVLRIDLYHSAAGSVVTVDVGDGGDDDRYFASIAMTAAQVRCWPNDAANVTSAATTGFMKTYNTEDTIDLTFDAYASAATKTMTYKMAVWYKMVGSVDDED